MTTPVDAQQYIGRTAVDPEGNKVGKIGQVYLDDDTGEPTWVTVSTGLFGTRQSFAPVFGSQLTGDDVTLAVSKDQIKDAPNVEDDAHVSAAEGMPSTSTTPATSAAASATLACRRRPTRSMASTQRTPGRIWPAGRAARGATPLGR